VKVNLQDRPLFWGTRGPPDAPIVFVGESWGAEEAQKQKPFVGSSGHELERMLARAAIPSGQILFTNVISAQPPGNETWRFFDPKDKAPHRIGGCAPSREARQHIERFYRQILAHPRQLVIAAGNWPLWALSTVTTAKVQSQSNNRLVPRELQTWTPGGILSWRGSMWHCAPHEELIEQFPRIPLLPVVHPAAILRAWYQRDPTIHDLRKRIPLALKNDWLDKYTPTFWAPPTFQQAVRKLTEWLSRAKRGETVELAADIETARGIMTCIGIADSPSFAMSIPFIKRVGDKGAQFDSYWTPSEEAILIKDLRQVLRHPKIRIVGQNFIYDTQYIQRDWGVTPHLYHDTMLHQNVCFPGTPKALEYLSSLYCHYHYYWKEDHKEWDMRGSVDDLLRYNCIDVARTWEIAQNQHAITRALGMEAQMALKMETNHLCLRMMNRGVLFDRDRSARTLVELNEALTQLERELLEIIPQEWVGEVGKRTKDRGGGAIYWLTSDTQQKRLFYDLLGFRVVNDPKSGQRTTGAKALGQFKLWYPEFTGFIERLELYSSIENTVNVLKSQVDRDGRMRCSYNPGGTETHRLSSSRNAFGGGTNLQNLTKGEEDE
jgi:uracil-DNA glycosylase